MNENPKFSHGSLENVQQQVQVDFDNRLVQFCLMFELMEGQAGWQEAMDSHAVSNDFLKWTENISSHTFDCKDAFLQT